MYALGRILQLVGVILLPVSLVGALQAQRRWPLAGSLVVCGIGIAVFLVGCRLQRRWHPLRREIDRGSERVVQLSLQGQSAEALQLARQVHEMARQYLGEKDPATATSLNNLGALLKAQGNLAEARACYERALHVRRRVLGPDHPDTALSLNNLGALLEAQGDLAGSRPCYEQALATRRRVLGPDHPDVATTLNNLGSLLCTQGDLVGARPYLEQALEVFRRVRGENHPDTATSLNNLGALLQNQGDLAAARPYYERALHVRRRVLGPNRPDVAASLNNLASLLEAQGDLAGARLLYEQALAIFRRALGEDHPLTATGLINLGSVLHAQGDRTEARSYYEQALHIRRRMLGPDHAVTAASLNSLGALLRSEGDLAGARAYYQQTLDVFRRTLGEDHPHTARSLNDLGALLRTQGDFVGARHCFARALEVRRRVLGPDHPDTATSLNNLGALLLDQGDLAEARVPVEQALAAFRRALGEDHPHTAACLLNLGGLLVGFGEAQQALALMLQAARVDDRMIGQLFGVGSDRQRAAFLETVQTQQHALLSLVWRHFAHAPAAVQAALDLVLRRKAITAEALAAQRDAVLGGVYPHLSPVLRQWSDLRAQVARQTLAGAGAEGREAHVRQLAQWQQRREQLEAELARQVPEMNLQHKLHAADRRAVALALPEGLTLVEFVRFGVFDFTAVPARGQRRWQPARYLAFVLRAGDPEQVRMIDLGEGEPIDRLVELFRASVSELREGQNMVRRPATVSPLSPAQAGQQLRAAVFDPLRDALDGCRRLLLSPDGNLTRLPFAVLPDADGRLLVDDYQLSYVNCGRDVLRFGAAASGTATAALVVADPDFDLATGVAEPSAERCGRISRDLPRDRIHFGRLPGTRGEGAAIAALLGVVPWQDVGALEARLKRECRSPRILHLATHGFFLQDEKHDPNQERRGLGLSLAEGRLSGPLPENPLLRAGLTLAGANTFLRGGSPPEEAEDGLLTAEDVSGLDLLATELVVLSACETGLGEVRTGEGVFGLQRAFTLAGAKTLVMSLWSVPDEATRELMEDFYRRILAGEGRADALRNAQLALRQQYPDPYFWGAFLCQGNPDPLAK